MQCTYLSILPKEVCFRRILTLLLDVTLPNTCKRSEGILLLNGLYFFRFEREKPCQHIWG